MRTTVRLDEALLNRARAEAARRGTTVTELIEQGLKLALRRPLKTPRRSRVHVPVSRARGGVVSGIDLDDSAALLDRLEGHD